MFKRPRAKRATFPWPLPPSPWPLVLLLAACASAQMKSFPKPSYFRETFRRPPADIVLNAPVRLKNFVVPTDHGPRLELSLKNYIELVMDNNTDIQLQLLTLVMPKDAIQTALGAWDPVAVASFSSQRSTSLAINATEARSTSAVTKSLSQPYSLSYNQTLSSGTQYTVSFSGAKTSMTNSYASFNPSLTSNMAISISQPLIRNRGRYVNRIPLMEAESKYKVAEDVLQGQLLTLVNTAETDYWNFVSARENLRVQQSARDTAKQYLDYMQKQLDLGAISPLDIYNPKQNLAAADLSVSQAQFALVLATDAVRHQIAADLDPDIRNLPIDLTEPVELGPADAMPVDREESVRKAMDVHPAIEQAMQTLDVDDLRIQGARNGLLPDLRLRASYVSQGRGGIFYPSASTILGAAGGGPIIGLPGGFSDAWGQMWGFGYPVYYAGLTLTLPIRNRAASAALADAMVRKRNDMLTLRDTQQQIRLSILNAVNRFEGAKEQLKLAKVQRDYADLNLKAENQKYELGTDSNQNVILAQKALLQAESAMVTNEIAVRLNLLNLLTRTGELLDARGIVVK